MTIQNLFTEVNYNDFPDQVNEPTLARLNLFLKGVKLPPAEGVTVRELVRRMLKISVPDVCQCWRMFDSLCMAAVVGGAVPHQAGAGAAACGGLLQQGCLWHYARGLQGVRSNGQGR